MAWPGRVIVTGVRYSDQETYGLSNLDILSRDFSRIYKRLFPGEPVLSLAKFNQRAYEEILLSLEESFGLEPEPETLNTLERGVTEMVNLAEDLLDHLPAEADERGEVLRMLTRLMYLRSYILIHTGQFCEAGMESREAVQVLKKMDRNEKDPSQVYCSARIMFQGLLNAAFVRYYTGGRYVPSDCMSTCGYCQDPISTLAQEGAKSLSDMKDNPESVKRVESIWGVAAAMLAAYMVTKGGDPLNGKYPDCVHPGVKMAYRLMVRDEKAADFPWAEMVGDYTMVLDL